MSVSMASPESFTFTVGKLDAGMAILLGERAHLIEFPSILLPPGATTGSIVNIAVHQNHAAERKRDNEFWELQNEILDMYGREIPKNPDLQVRNVTQTSVTLEWPPIDLATSKLRSLDIYRNGQRLAAIPAPLTNTSTKVSGLELMTDYTFQLILRTTAGTFPSNLAQVRTHSMTDTSGICVCFGNIQDELLLENAKMALREMGAKWSDKIQIDTTHFLCTTPAATPVGAQASGSAVGAPGVEYQRALQLSIPVVQPHWILACLAEKRMVPIAQYYLGAATPASGPASAAVYSNRPQSVSYTQGPHSAPAGGGGRGGVRASMPPPARSPPGTASASFVNNQHVGSPVPAPSRPTTIPEAVDPEAEDVALHGAGGSGSGEDGLTSTESKRKSRAGTMNKAFKFPPDPPSYSPSSSPKSSSSSPPPKRDSVGPVPVPKIVVGEHESKGSDGASSGSERGRERQAAAANIEVPPPPPVEKERSHRASLSDGDDDLGDDTVDIPL